MRIQGSVAVGIAVCLTGCGYIGDVQYPALNIPKPVVNLSVVELGDHLDVNFTIPEFTIEGLAVKSVGAIDLRVGPDTGPDFRIGPWAESATRIDVKPPSKPGPVNSTIPVNAFIGKTALVAVRVANGRGRESDWSNVARVQVVAPLVKPSGLTAIDVPQGVQLKWNAPGEANFRVFRASEKLPQPALVGTADKPEYVDTTSTYGLKYEYYVQAYNGEAQSETAGPVELTPKDTFPPAVPAGVTATAGVNAVDIAWERNSEPDFRGYNLFRSVGDQPFTKIGELLPGASYSDRNIEAGKKYRYAVTAVDQAGNESGKSAVAEVTVP